MCDICFSTWQYLLVTSLSKHRVPLSKLSASYMSVTRIFHILLFNFYQNSYIVFLFLEDALTESFEQPNAGELQEWRNPLVSEACSSWKWLWAQVSAPGEGGCEWEECPSPVCVPQGKAPFPQWWAKPPYDWPKINHVEPRLQEWRGLELREVPHRARWSPLQAL